MFPLVFSCCFSLCEQDGEGCALADFAYDPDLAAMRLDNVFDDGQSQAGAAEFAVAGRIAPVEALEQARQMLGCDPCPEILHLDGDFFSVALLWPGPTPCRLPRCT